MAQLPESFLLDDQPLTLDQFAFSCTVTREWVVEHVEAGVLQAEGDTCGQWCFTSTHVLRARRLLELERQFDANPELAGLVVDLLDEVRRLRTRLRRTDLQADRS